MIFDGSTGGRWMHGGTEGPPVSPARLVTVDHDFGGHPVEEDPSIFRHPATRYPGRLRSCLVITIPWQSTPFTRISGEADADIDVT